MNNGELLNIESRASDGSITKEDVNNLICSVRALQSVLDNYSSHEVFIKDLAQSWVAEGAVELGRVQSIIDCYVDKANAGNNQDIKDFMEQLVSELINREEGKCKE